MAQYKVVAGSHRAKDVDGNERLFDAGEVVPGITKADLEKFPNKFVLVADDVADEEEAPASQQTQQAPQKPQQQQQQQQPQGAAKSGSGAAQK